MMRRYKAVRLHSGNLLAMLDFDLAINDKLACSHVDVVTTTTLKVLQEEAYVI